MKIFFSNQSDPLLRQNILTTIINFSNREQSVEFKKQGKSHININMIYKLVYDIMQQSSIIMVFYVLMVIFLAFLFTTLLVVITCINCLGLTGMVRTYLQKYGSANYDRQFQEGDGPPLNKECFICHEQVKLEVVTTCNHSYCASCITEYIDSKAGSSINCPACRKPICVLIRKFAPTSGEELTYREKICEYNFRHSQEPSFIRSLLEFTNIVRHLPMLLSRDGVRFLLTDSRVRIILIMIIYTLSPFDILPEVFLGPIGLADDSVVFANILTQVSGLLVRFISDERNRNRSQ